MSAAMEEIVALPFETSDNIRIFTAMNVLLNFSTTAVIDTRRETTISLLCDKTEAPRYLLTNDVYPGRGGGVSPQVVHYEPNLKYEFYPPG